MGTCNILLPKCVEIFYTRNLIQIFFSIIYILFTLTVNPMKKAGATASPNKFITLRLLILRKILVQNFANHNFKFSI